MLLKRRQDGRQHSLGISQRSVWCSWLNCSGHDWETALTGHEPEECVAVWVVSELRSSLAWVTGLQVLVGTAPTGMNQGSVSYSVMGVDRTAVQLGLVGRASEQ